MNESELIDKVVNLFATKAIDAGYTDPNMLSELVCTLKARESSQALKGLYAKFPLDIPFPEVADCIITQFDSNCCVLKCTDDRVDSAEKSARGVTEILCGFDKVAHATVSFFTVAKQHFDSKFEEPCVVADGIAVPSGLTARSLLIGKVALG
jgi:hypothetical protein